MEGGTCPGWSPISFITHPKLRLESKLCLESRIMRFNPISFATQTPLAYVEFPKMEGGACPVYMVALDLDGRSAL